MPGLAGEGGESGERPVSGSGTSLTARMHHFSRRKRSALDAGQSSCLILQIIAQTGGRRGWPGRTERRQRDVLTNRITSAHMSDVTSGRQYPLRTGRDETGGVECV